MRGEQFIINALVLKHPENPIKEEIMEKSPEKIIEVIQDEYWKEWKRKLTYSEFSSINAVYLGSFTTDLWELKSYIGGLIKQIRILDARIAKFKENPMYDEKNSMSYYLREDCYKKLRITLKQLDERRKIMILRYLKWAKKKKEVGEEWKIKRNYEWFDFSFTK